MNMFIEAIKLATNGADFSEMRATENCWVKYKNVFQMEGYYRTVLIMPSELEQQFIKALSKKELFDACEEAGEVQVNNLLICTVPEEESYTEVYDLTTGDMVSHMEVA